MTELEAVDSGLRVAAILTDPEAYFAEAARRAWESAAADVAADLEARAEHRRNHAEPRPNAAATSWTNKPRDYSSRSRRTSNWP